MPGYEFSLILRVMEKPQLVSAVKRSLAFMLDNGGVVKKIESLGEKTLPFRIRAHQEHFTKGHYFVVDLEAAPTLPDQYEGFQHRDIDIIRHGVRRREDAWQQIDCEGPYSDLYTGAKTVNKYLLTPKRKKGTGVKWPNTDKI